MAEAKAVICELTNRHDWDKFVAESQVLGDLKTKRTFRDITGVKSPYPSSKCTRCGMTWYTWAHGPSKRGFAEPTVTADTSGW